MERIAKLRRERGWSQVKLGAKADVNPSTVNQIERGMRRPNSTTLEKLAGALEVDVAELFPKAEAPDSGSGREQDVLAFAELGKRLSQDWEQQFRERSQTAVQDPARFEVWAFDAINVAIRFIETAEAAGLDPAQDEGVREVAETVYKMLPSIRELVPEAEQEQVDQMREAFAEAGAG